jgi:hypothetical protein
LTLFGSANRVVYHVYRIGIMRLLERSQARIVASCLAASLVATAASESFAAVKNWASGNGAWATGGNWSPVGAPAAGDTIMIGPHASAANTQVTLNTDADVASLTINDGMVLRTATGFLDVAGTTQIAGQNVVGPTTHTSRLRVEDGNAGTDFRTDNLTLTSSAQVVLEESGSMIVLGTATLADSTQLRGHGSVYFDADSGSILINDGRIEATAGGMSLYQTAAGRFNLDGNLSNGELVAQTHDGTGLVINGDQLTDAFSGDIILGANSRLDMNLTNGWAADMASSITVIGTGSASPAILDGGTVLLQGSIAVTGPAARFRIAATSEVASTLTATVTNGNDLQFYNDTSVSGGSFTTEGTGLVSFLGPSTWQGTVTVDGNARVNGMAFVLGTTVINGENFDMDGTSGVTIWNIEAPLTVNTTHIDSTTNAFDGAMAISGAAGNQFTVNLADPEEAWQMDGTLDLSGTTGLWRTRVAGSPMQVGGTINIANSNIDIAAEVTLFASSEINFSAATSDLRFSGDSHIEAGATFTGQGLLHNNSSAGGMVLANGVSLGEAGLVNGGRLTIGDDEPGQVFVDRFSSEADATLSMWVGGNVPGTELSHLIATDAAAQLDGTLNLRLFDDGGGLFAPDPDDMFTIVTAPGGIVGQFDTLVQPLGLPTGMRFNVIYGPNAVTLFMDGTFAADFDRDGDVDQSDYDVWKAAYGLNNFGDANSDGLSDAADYTIWRDQLGAGLPMVMASGAGGVSAVPEASSLALALLGCLGFSQRRHRIAAV